LTVWLELAGRKVKVELPASAAAGGVCECLVDGRPVTIDAKVLQPGVMSLLVPDSQGIARQFRCVLDGDAVVVDGRRHEFTVYDPRSLAGRLGSGGGADGPRPVKAPMPGRVVRVLVAVGDEVVEGQGVVVIEAMKMQNELKSPKAGLVARVGVGVGDTVGSGDVLVVVE
jgi:biotin carboxyl carrier protein